ncbi:MAG: encapsulin-associated ferritin-like protein [Gammaproteobacteria bacterium]|nr:encapsulin-associated ferritin-like protein [Gammaproteobacteria bacterium]MDZ7753256.1 encapsulin-associated ferritin-like protein [Gammaproteobacteria bacterium]
MTEASATLHEPAEMLSGDTIDLHRALVSLQEELEAVDWYRQRADACGDEELRDILRHNMREEMEHAAMLLEWLRRNEPDFAGQMAEYLNTTGPITAAEAEGGTAAAESPGPEAAEEPDVEAFTIGNLKE